jgi:hypothetical protein
MNATETVIAGILKADGTLELKERPKLSPGPVTVVLRQEATIATPPAEEFFQAMEEIWAGQKARGHVPRSAAQAAASRQEMRDQIEGEVQAAVRLQEDSQRQRDQAHNQTPQPRSSVSIPTL